MDADRAPVRPGLSMLGWALNEEENLTDYVNRAEAFLHSVSDDYELILIDDGSSDRTWALACELAASRPWLTVLKNDRNRGPGFCYRRAIGAATKQYFMAQTVDWAYDIERLGRNFDRLRQYDILQGVRPGEFSWTALATRSDNLFKAVVSFTNYGLIKFLFRLPFDDFQNITVCPSQLAKSLHLESTGSFTNPEVMMKLYWTGASFLQVAVPFRKRDRGRGSGTRVKAILTSISEIFRYWFQWIVLRQYPNRMRGSVASLDA
jgi:glycosyltransferase involved in cell wall biosynthesis